MRIGTVLSRLYRTRASDSRRPLMLTSAVAVLLLWAPAYAQHITPLFNFVESNSQLSYPEELRTFRTHFDKELGNVKPGLAADVLYKRVTALRAFIDSSLRNITRGWDSTAKGFVNESTRLADSIGFIASRQFTAEGVVTTARGYIDRVTAPLVMAISNSFRSDEARGAMLYVIQQVAVDVGMPDTTYDGIDTRAELEGRVRVLIDTLALRLLQQAMRDLGGAFLTNDSVPASMAARALAGAIDRTRESISKILDRAEKTLTYAATSFSHFLVGANLGIAAAPGDGVLSGGLLLSWTPNKYLQIGAFTNLLASALADSAPGYGLTGLQVRFTGDRFQLQFFGGVYYGNHRHFRDLRSYDLGVGLSASIAQKVVFGGAAFYTSRENRSSLFSVALSIRSMSPKSPTIYIGLAGDDFLRQRISPMFHIAYPIIPSN
jgi:hypothetical protein